MNNTLAALVNDLGNSQSNFFMIKEFNSGVIKSPFCFYNNIYPHIIQPNFAVMNVSYLPHFNGSLFCTTVNCADIALRAQSNYKIYLYMWDMTFMKCNDDYTYNMSIFRNPEISIITRSVSHYAAIENFCGKKPKAIIDNWDINKIKELIKV
jgi:hypothetical protein